jgi:hypothetical protein
LIRLVRKSRESDLLADPLVAKDANRLVQGFDHCYSSFSSSKKGSDWALHRELSELYTHPKPASKATASANTANKPPLKNNQRKGKNATIASTQASIDNVNYYLSDHEGLSYHQWFYKFGPGMYVTK